MIAYRLSKCIVCDSAEAVPANVTIARREVRAEKCMLGNKEKGETRLWGNLE